MSLHPEIQIRRERKRGCGWRKTGGMYMVSGAESQHCEGLPVRLDVCPTCGEGIKPSRGWTWVDGRKLMVNKRACDTNLCDLCPLGIGNLDNEEFGKVGLLWVGVKFYPSPHHFEQEAEALGISRRIAAVPNDFVLGETWVMLAHRNAIVDYHQQNGAIPEFVPGVFTFFKPSAVEVVVDGTESDEEIERYLERGLTPVLVEKVEETNGRLELPVNERPVETQAPAK